MLSNPAAWEDLRDRGFERITKLSRGRQAALDYEQVPAFYRAVRARPGIVGRALEVTLLTRDSPDGPACNLLGVSNIPVESAAYASR